MFLYPPFRQPLYDNCRPQCLPASLADAAHANGRPQSAAARSPCSRRTTPSLFPMLKGNAERPAGRGVPATECISAVQVRLARYVGRLELDAISGGYVPGSVRDRCHTK